MCVCVYMCAHDARVNPTWLLSIASPSVSSNPNPIPYPHECAGELIALGLAGALGECYQPLDEGLPLVGVLGMQAADGRVLDVQEVQRMLLQQPPDATAQGPPQSCAVHAQAQPGLCTASGGGSGSQGLQGAGADGGVGVREAVARGHGAEARGRDAGGMAQDDDFEMWMQLVSIGGGGRLAACMCANARVCVCTQMRTCVRCALDM